MGSHAGCECNKVRNDKLSSIFFSSFFLYFVFVICNLYSNVYSVFVVICVRFVWTPCWLLANLIYWLNLLGDAPKQDSNLTGVGINNVFHVFLSSSSSSQWTRHLNKKMKKKKIITKFWTHSTVTVKGVNCEYKIDAQMYKNK